MIPQQDARKALMERIIRFIGIASPEFVPCEACRGVNPYCAECGGVGEVLHPDENADPRELLRLALEALSASSGSEEKQQDSSFYETWFGELITAVLPFVGKAIELTARRDGVHDGATAIMRVELGDLRKLLKAVKPNGESAASRPLDGDARRGNLTLNEWRARFGLPPIAEVDRSTSSETAESAFREGYDFGQADRRWDVTDVESAWAKSGTRQAQSSPSQPAQTPEERKDV